MVGYDPSATQLTSTAHGVAGAVSGVLTRFSCQPLDVLKIRFQLQQEPVSRAAGSKYRGVLQALSQIVRDEGPTALFKGMVPAQWLSVVYGAVQFATFEGLTRKLQRLTADPSRESGVGLHFVTGAVAGVAASAASLPLDVVRTRLVVQSEPKYYTGMMSAMRSMLRQEGVRSFYKGGVPTMLQTAPYTSLQFGAYTAFSQLVDRWHLWQERPSTKALVCGVLAGLAAKTAVYPLDVVKKRLQVQGFQQHRVGFGAATPAYRGLLDCLWQMARNEGLRGVYKGLAPATLKAMATTGLHFTFYELVVRLMREARDS